MERLRAFLNEAEPAYLRDLATLVNRDCGTFNKTGVDAVGEWVAARAAEWGWEVSRLPLVKYGDCWTVRLRGRGQGRLMLSGHLDTVYPDGTAAGRPMRTEGGRILGPGTCDMKAGVLSGMYAMRALEHIQFDDFAEITFFLSSDEEVGSPESRALYAPLAGVMEAAFVMEAARANGDIVSARKAAGLFRIAVSGKSAHAGVEPQKGANAILELAHQIISAQSLNGIAPGVTVNAGIVTGGARTNIVPDEAHVDLDVRANDMEGMALVSRALADLPSRARVLGTQVSLSGSFGVAPMPKTPAAAALVQVTQAIAGELGFSVNDTATGGVSDANVIAGLGVPVLDGLGPIGGLDHSPDEYVDASSIVPRTVLVAELMRRTLGMRERLAAMRR